MELDSSANLDAPILSNADVTRGMAMGTVVPGSEHDASFHVTFDERPQFFCGDAPGTQPGDPEDHITLRFPGTKDTLVKCLKDYPEMKRRFGIQHQAWKDGHTTGTPLEQWDKMPKGIVPEFRLANIYTVEQLANASDSTVQKLPNGSIELRKAAQEAVFERKNSAVIEELRAEKQELADQLNALSAQVAALMAAQSGPPSKREK